jgi:hypothetical protein
MLFVPLRISLQHIEKEKIIKFVNDQQSNPKSKK